MKTHTTKEGNEMLISDMTTSHLFHTINLVIRNSKKGLLIQTGSSAFESMNDFDYDEYWIYGEEALKALNYQDYVNELNRRI